MFITYIQIYMIWLLLDFKYNVLALSDNLVHSFNSENKVQRFTQF